MESTTKPMWCKVGRLGLGIRTLLGYKVQDSLKGGNLLKLFKVDIDAKGFSHYAKQRDVAKRIPFGNRVGAGLGDAAPLKIRKDLLETAY
jgi:hypothetical protein